MNEIDRIKGLALEKLDSAVKTELKYVEGNNLGLEGYNLNILEDYFTKEEVGEITNSIEQAKNNPKTYCCCRGIESILFK